jgi:hypothetical protein
MNTSNYEIYQKCKSEEVTITEYMICSEDKLTSENFKCLICFGIVQKPRECSTCNSVFCKKCIRTWETYKEICPNKCENFLPRKMNRKLREILNRIKVNCNNIGCSKSSEYHDYYKHLDSCDFGFYLCASYGCQYKSIKQKVIKHHETCQYVKEDCNRCHLSYYRNELSEHQDLCLEKIISCQFCCKLMKRKELATHPKEDCFALIKSCHQLEIDGLKVSQEKEKEDIISNFNLDIQRMKFDFQLSQNTLKSQKEEEIKKAISHIHDGFEEKNRQKALELLEIQKLKEKIKSQLVLKDEEIYFKIEEEKKRSNIKLEEIKRLLIVQSNIEIEQLQNQHNQEIENLLFQYELSLQEMESNCEKIIDKLKLKSGVEI